MAEAKALEGKRRTYPAACDIYEENGQVICKIEMPGVNKETLDIKVDGERLIVNGRRTTEQSRGEYLIHEIRDGDFYHEFTIDDTIDHNKIDASIKNGVVTLMLGIKESEKPRKINVIAK